MSRDRSRRTAEDVLEVSPGNNMYQPSLYILDLRCEPCRQLRGISLARAIIGNQRVSDIVSQGLADAGLVLVRLPADQIANEALDETHIAIGKDLGQLMRQNRAGSRLVKVRDTTPSDTEATRGFLSNTAMKLHTDGWDAAGLLCLRPAHIGGDSLFVRSQAIYDRLLALRPDLAASLMEDWDWDIRVLCEDEEREPLVRRSSRNFRASYFVATVAIFCATAARPLGGRFLRSDWNYLICLTPLPRCPICNVRYALNAETPSG